MSFPLREILMRSAAAGLFAAACALPPGAARAQDKTPMVMKISLAALNDPLHQFAKDFAAADRQGFRRPHQDRNLSGEPARLDPAPDRRHAIRRHPMRGHAAGILFRHRRALRGDGRARACRLARARAAARRRSGSAEADARAWRRQGLARRRPVHLAAVIHHRQERGAPSRRPARARSFGSSPRSSRARRSGGSARRR